jgi:polysaccharide lyase-like protein
MHAKVYVDFFGTAIAYVGLGAVLLGAADEARAQVSALRLDAGWEQGQMYDYLGPSGNPPVPTREQSREGGWSLRSFLDRKNSPVSFRTEVAGPQSMKIGEEHWAGISIYFPESHVASDTWEVVYQVHDTPADWSNGRQPIFSVWSQAGVGGQFGILGFYDPRRDGTNTTKAQAFLAWAGTIKPGWNDFVFHWKWAYDHGQGGFTQVWIDGVQVLNYSGPNCYNDVSSPFAKFGLYMGWQDRNEPADRVSTRVVYHDAYREAGANGSYELVAPRGSANGSAIAKPGAPILSVR